MVQVNFVVDCSGSMGAIAFNPLRNIGLAWQHINRFQMARWELVSMLIEGTIYMSHEDTTFQIVEFESYPNLLVPTSKRDAALRTLEKQRSEAHLGTPPSRDKDGNYIAATSGKYLPFYPRGGTNIPEGLKATLKGADKNVKNITILITDMWDPEGKYISDALNADCGNGDSCFKALADLGPVYVIILSDYVKVVSGRDNLQLEKSCKNLDKIISKDYGIKWNGCFYVASGLDGIQRFNHLLFKLTDEYGTLP